LKTPRSRTPKDLKAIKTLCDLYYTNPPVTLDEVRNARLHSLYVIDVDNLTAQEIDVETYTGNRLSSLANFART
jgi:hypothetical protein